MALGSNELYPKETIARPGCLVIRELAHESLASLRSSYERERVDMGTHPAFLVHEKILLKILS